MSDTALLIDLPLKTMYIFRKNNLFQHLRAYEAPKGVILTDSLYARIFN